MRRGGNVRLVFGCVCLICMCVTNVPRNYARDVGAGAAGAAAAGPKLRAQKKNNLTIISAYASFLGNDSVTRPTSTCTIDMAHSCSFLPDKFYPTKAFSVDLVPRECRDYQGRWRLIRPHLSWIINYLNFFSALRDVILAAWPIKICFLRPAMHANNFFCQTTSASALQTDSLLNKDLNLRLSPG